MKPLTDWTPEEVLADPTASDWLKNALRSAIERDPVDAADDAEALAQLLRGHMMRAAREARNV